ncbi:bifunctional DNA primase/polymerase [Gimesia sp.]|uniref:bifunctional DNA primase/polymerase n=1 Tax=Gimesia sp. TaxID=2024833 RepID=UPI003A8D59A0
MQSKKNPRSILKSCSQTCKQEIYRAALRYRKAGLSLIPIATNQSKAPAFDLLPLINADGSKQNERKSWKVFQKRKPHRSEINHWYSLDKDIYGIAIVAGKVSGNLEILDLDNSDIIEPFCLEVESRAPGLLDKLPKVETPRPGLHCYYRCEKIEGNQKLAKIIPSDSANAQTIIETRGEGGYCLAPPSPATCHPSLKCYQYYGDKDLSMIPQITITERKHLLEAARVFDECSKISPQKTRPTLSKKKQYDLTRPGDDFNFRGKWAEILEPHGWMYAGTGTDHTDRWTRPGKDQGFCSASTNYMESDLLYVFSSNAEPFEINTAYSKFHAYTLLNCAGDFSEAASELKFRGYGKNRYDLKSKRSWRKDLRK